MQGVKRADDISISPHLDIKYVLVCHSSNFGHAPAVMGKRGAFCRLRVHG